MGLFDFMRKKEPDNVVGAGTAIDPVCHMTVDVRSPPGGASQHGAQTYYFCSPGCKRSFDADPHKFLGPHAH